MSRSRRKNKIFPNSGDSEKYDKRLNNRMFRKRTRMFIRSGFFNRLPQIMNEIRSTWSMRKDGKHFWKNPSKKDMSK